MDTSTKPRLQPVDELLETAVGHEEPGLLLAEASDHLSLVLFKTAEVRDLGHTLWLEGCHWVLFAPAYVGVCPLDGVAVLYSEEGYWIVREPRDRWLRMPSERAYLVRFIAAEEHALFAACLHLMKMNTFLEHAVDYFAAAPGFRKSPGGTLVAPADYASVAAARIPRWSLLEVPDEFRLS
ncbi:MAG TPA: hypothetical protein VG733_02815 [Chthoniobacteraceae bacterium]|nr:hypothetical protein [Chthoniobacteraceae bacterium]